MKRSPIPHETHFLTKPRVINDQQNHSLIPVRVFCVFRGLYFVVLFFFQIHIGHLRFLNPGHARRQSKQSISLYEHAQPTHQLNPISCISCVSWSIFRGLIFFQIHVGHLRFLSPGHARRKSKQSISLYEHAQPTHQLNPVRVFRVCRGLYFVVLFFFQISTIISTKE